MTTSTTFQQDIAKLVEAVIYLCELSIGDPAFGVSKLTKLLYYADCDSYLEYGEPITGTTYLHFPHGPHPENWYQLREQMERNGDVEILSDGTPSGYQKYRILALRAPDLELLSPNDRAMIKAQVERFGGYNEAGIEQYAQEEVGWLSTENGQPIPYALAGVVAPPLSLKDILAWRSSSRPA